MHLAVPLVQAQLPDPRIVFGERCLPPGLPAVKVPARYHLVDALGLEYYLTGVGRVEEGVEVVLEGLDDIGVRYCGRYGDWGYMWTDESFISGERAADAALSRA